MIYGNATGGFGMPKTLILTDSNGNEITGVVTDNEVVFTAGLNDIRAGKVAANADGVVTGTKDIPSYHTTVGVQAIPANSEFKIIITDADLYDYTELQAMTMPYNSSMSDSMAVDRVIIKDNVYNVGSATAISTVTKNINEKSISLGVTNGSTPAVIRFFTYKEEL